MSPPNAAPPPPPPPPPLDGNGNGGLQCPHQLLQKTLPNGDLQMPQANGIIIGGTGQHIVGAKKLLPPFHDSRTDLMKSIRDGKYST